MLALIFPGLLMAQMSESQLWENAKYKSVVEGVQVYYTDVNAIDHEFDEEVKDHVRTIAFQKDGIVKVEFLHESFTIRVYHYDFIDLETVKGFVLSLREDIEVMNRKEFSF
jgi:hypothetical protein